MMDSNLRFSSFPRFATESSAMLPPRSRGPSRCKSAQSAGTQGRMHSLRRNESPQQFASHPLLRFSWQPLSQRKTTTVSSPAGDGTAATGLLHRADRTGLSRPLPGSYRFFPVGMLCLSPRAHDRNRGDSSSHRSHKHQHLMRTITAKNVNSALHQLAFSKLTPK